MVNTITAQAPTLSCNSSSSSSSSSENTLYTITFDEEKILSISPVNPGDSSSVGLQFEGQPCNVGPALIDIQVNGYAGKTMKIKSPDEKNNLRVVTDHLRQVGVGMYFPTICTDSYEVTLAALTHIAEVLDSDKDLASSIGGVHLEGPYLSPEDGWRGAHPLQHTRQPSWDEFQKWQAVSGNRIKIMTVAAEVPGIPEFIKKATQSGVVISIGHSNMNKQAWDAAVDAGATLSTHLGNGCLSSIDRHNNHLWPQCACRKTFASFICDGHHLPPDCLYSLLHAKGPEKSILISDSVLLAGMPSGVYKKGHLEVEKLASGRLVKLGTPYLAGSACNLLDCIPIAMRDANYQLSEVWNMATHNPAQLLKMDSSHGSLEVGKAPNFTIYTVADPVEGSNGAPVVKVFQTWVGGRLVHDATTAQPLSFPEKLEGDSLL
eukprot:TRINITY_DN68019_c6_g4_i1.p1 TRINITY_DN68019_c6_g4~~TRINITY_DN68019_c6_g4_i1.p1  ORF type:complete len:433 (+),score=39.71 TRINITY_DN68019_c6_g4_i1:77-1375(+)